MRNTLKGTRMTRATSISISLGQENSLLFMGAKLDHHDHWEKIIVAPWCCFTNQTGEKIVRWRVAQKHERKHFEIFLFRAMSKFHQGRWYGQAAWSWKFRSGTKLKTHTPWIIDGSPRTNILIMMIRTQSLFSMKVDRIVIGTLKAHLTLVYPSLLKTSLWRKSQY